MYFCVLFFSLFLVSQQQQQKIMLCIYNLFFLHSIMYESILYLNMIIIL